MKTISFSLTDKQYCLLTRIAEADDRRLSDLVQLLFGRGLEYFYCETPLSIKKIDSDYSEEDRKQQSKNEELENSEGWNKLSWEEKREKGWAHVCDYMQNWGGGNRDFVEDLAKEVMYAATHDIKES